VAVEMKEVESIEDHLMAGMRAAMLERLERGTTGCVDGDKLAVHDDRHRVQPAGGRGNGRVVVGQVPVVAGADLDVVAVLDQQRAIAVELDLIQPRVALG
jgi:hypothetical protein